MHWVHLLIVWFKVHDDIIFIKLLGDGTCMNIYDLLKECIEIKKATMNFYDHCCKKSMFPAGIEPTTSA